MKARVLKHGLFFGVMLFAGVAMAGVNSRSIDGVDRIMEAEVAGGDAVVKRELENDSLSFRFTDDSTNPAPDVAVGAGEPVVTGDAIIQRELASESLSFGFTD